MRQHQHPVEKREERVKDPLGVFLGAGLAVVYIISLPRSIGHNSVTQFCLDAREGYETEFQPEQLLASNNSPACTHEGNRNL